MGLGIKTNATYLNVRNGKLYRYSKTNEEGTTTILTKKGEPRYYFVYDFIEGYITKLSTRTEVIVGEEKLFLSVQMSDDSDVYYVNMDVNSRYFDAFCSIVPNVDLSRPVKLIPTQKEVDGKMKSGLMIIQNGQVVKWFYTNANPNGRPEIEVTKNKKGEVVDYDAEARNQFYFDLLGKLNEKMLPAGLVPPVKEVGTKFEEEVGQADFSSGDDDDDMLPF